MIRKLIAAVCLSVLTMPQVWASDIAEFWQTLQEGGKVVLIRHAALDKEFGNPFVLDDTCFTERNLNEFGQAQADWINQQLKQRQIPVEKVMSSPHCRTRETAERLAKDIQPIEVNTALRLTKAVNPHIAEHNIQNTRKLISEFKGKGNLILVTHRPNIGELIYQKVDPAEMIIVEAFDESTLDIVERLKVPLTAE